MTQGYQLDKSLTHSPTVFFPSLTTWTWDTFLTLRGSWDFYLNHVIQPKPIESVLDNALLDHGVYLLSCPPWNESFIPCYIYSLSF